MRRRSVRIGLLVIALVALGSYYVLRARQPVLTLTGLDCGPVRSPLRKLTDSERARIKQLHAEIF